MPGETFPNEIQFTRSKENIDQQQTLCPWLRSSVSSTIDILTEGLLRIRQPFCLSHYQKVEIFYGSSERVK